MNSDFRRFHRNNFANSLHAHITHEIYYGHGSLSNTHRQCRQRSCQQSNAYFESISSEKLSCRIRQLSSGMLSIDTLTSNIAQQSRLVGMCIGYTKRCYQPPDHHLCKSGRSCDHQPTTITTSHDML